MNMEDDKIGTNPDPFKITLDEGWDKVNVEKLRAKIEEIMEKRDPDIIIFENETIFYAKFINEKYNLNTGIGGLKLLFKELDEWKYLLKIQYNGHVLDLDQARKFIDQIMSYK